MRPLRLVLGTLLAFAMFLPATPADAGKNEGKKQTKRHFDLRWLPTNTPNTEPLDLTGLGSVRLVVSPLTDGRPVPATIGENREEGDKGALPVTTDSSVADFLTQALKDELRRSGLPVESDNPTHVLRGSIQEFTVVLDGTYKGSARVRLTLEDAAGNEKWSGLMSGGNTRFSMREGPANYLNSLCDALLEAIEAFVRSDSFMKALRS